MKDVRNELQYRSSKIKGFFNIVDLLKDCGKQRDLSKGSKLHAYIQNHTYLEKDCYIGSSLVSMYARCGALAKAQQVLNDLLVRDIITWNALIAGYAQQGQGDEALKCFDNMQQEGYAPNAVTFVCALKACGRIGAISKGENIHKRVNDMGLLEKNVVLGNTLVDMYARCGELEKARQVLNKLPIRDTATWNTLITAYAQKGQGDEALNFFDNMQQTGYFPDTITFISALKACGSIGAVAKGEKIHDKLVSSRLLEKNIVLGTAVVDMYARCGALVKARKVLDELPVRNVITWTTVIAGYGQQGQSEEALRCLDRMQWEGHTPDAVTFIFALKACASIGSSAKGEKIHEKIVSLGMLEKDSMVGTSLIDMYARCGALAKAKQVLHELPVRNAVMWTALIGGYAQHGQGEEALKCFANMQREGHSPNVVTFISALKACGSVKAVAEGEKIHDRIASLGLLESDAVLGNTLVDMYARSGVLAKAQKVADEILVRDVVTWNILIAGNVQQNQAEEALKCFDTMQCEGHCPGEVTFIYALKACGSIQVASTGERIHDKIVNLGMLKEDIVLGNALVDMYAKCGAFTKAWQVLDELDARNEVTWNALIAGYVQQGQGEEALKCFDSMQHEGQSPNTITFIGALKACGIIGTATKGEMIQDKIADLGLLEKDIALGNSLVDMYAKCGALAKAQQLFDWLPVWNEVTWNALIAGYAHQAWGQEALRCFDNMQQKGYSPDSVTFICALKACGGIGAVVKGERIHDQIVNSGMLEKNVVLGNTLVDMYARCGALAKARQVLYELPVRDVITWTSLSAGYMQQGQGEDALECFDSMQAEGHSPNEVTFICALKACGSVGAAAKGEQIHENIISRDMLEDISLGNALVDMYAKCGASAKAVEVLEELPIEDIVTWNALIGGYALQGQSGEALESFKRMQSKGILPDKTTLVCVLTACSHSGLLQEAEVYFSRMSVENGITLDVEHFCCMVDLFGRAGTFNKAFVIIEKMPCTDYLPLWLALLNACRKYGDAKIGRWIFKHVCCLDKHDFAPYLCMANIYAAAGIQHDEDKIEVMKVANESLILLMD